MLSPASAQVIDKHDVQPIYSKAINGTCLVIGGTNTELASGKSEYNSVSSVDMEKADLANVLAENFKGEQTAGGKTVSIYNSSFANFCIPSVRCGQLNFEVAQLNWGGRVNPRDEDLMEDRETVYIKFATSSYESPVYEVTADITREPGKFYYSCHADITTILENIKENLSTGQVSLYVGNVASSLAVVNEAAEGDKPSLSSTASGWSLDLVYANASLPRRNIAIYNYDKLQFSNSLGDENAYLNPQFQFAWSGASPAEAFQYSMCDTITFIYSAFGGQKNMTADAMYFGTGGAVFDIEKDKFKIPYVNSLNTARTTNHFSSGIDYEYEVDGCNVGKAWEYSPGYDLHTITIDPGSKFDRINQNAPAFSLLVPSYLEHHFLTNVVLVTGAPETPQVQLFTRSPGSVSPGEKYDTDVTFSVGDNKEGLTNMVITVPISEYVDSITAITTKCIPDEVKKANSSTYTYRVTIYSEDRTCPAAFQMDISFSEFCNGLNDENKKKLLNSVNKYLAYVNEYNDQHRYVNPADFKLSRIVFNFNKVVVPKTVSKKDVLKIGFTLKTKKEGDPVYFETTYVSKRPAITPEAEISLKTEQTGETSIFENTLEDNEYWDKYRCMISGGGGGGGGCAGCPPECPSLDGSKNSAKGVFVKENPIDKHIVVVTATSVCRQVPDSLSYTICSETEVSIDDLNYQLVSKYDFNIDSIARVDSCIWEARKRDSLIAFAAKHGVNKSRLEKLLSDATGSLLDFTGKVADAYGCDNGEGAPQSFVDSLNLIASAKIRTSRLYALYTAKDTTEIYQKTKSLLVVPDNYAETYTVDDEKTLYLYYQSPWVNGSGDSCSRFIPVYFHKRDIPAPIVNYDSEDLQNNDTIYLCLEGNIMDMAVTKDRVEYDLYANISLTQEDSEELLDFRDVMIYNGFSKTYNWKSTEKGDFSSAHPGVYRFSVRQQTLDCKSDSVVFFVSVADMKIDQGPEIDDSETEFCQALDPKEKITLKINKTAEQKDYTVRWYNTRTTQAKAELIGTGDAIEVRKDSAETFRYGATFYSNKCESDTSIIYITVHPMPDTIVSDTISICQRYHLTSEDVFSVLRMKNSEQTLSAANVKFYKFIDHTDSDVAGNVWTSINQDSISLEKLLGTFDFESTCQEGGARYMNFVAQAVSENGCPGAGALITIKVNCFEDDQPKFGYPDDQVLLCMGAKWTGDYNDFLSVEDEKKKYPKGYRWIWFDATKNDHYTYKFGNTYYKTGENSAPVIDPSFVHSDLITVVRIDSNNCISKHDTFSVVVDTSINTYPIIEDSIIPVADKRFTLTYCKGDYTQTLIPISAVGFPSSDYRIEWYEKDDLNTTCKAIDSSDVVVMQSSVAAALENPGSTYYCVRQSTPLGCKGPWLTVQVVVYPDVTGVPQVTPAEYCQGAIPVPANVNAVNPDVTSYSLTYYRLDTSEEEGVTVKDTVAISEIKPSTKEAGVTTYYAALMDLKTKCKSPLFEIPVTVHPKPGSVVYDGDSILYYCAGIGDVNLAEEIPAKVNPDDKDTELMWLPSSTLSTEANAKVELGIYQRDTYTGCLGDTTKLAIKVENTFHYTPWPDRSYCWGDTINMCDTINKRIRLVNNYIDSTSIGYVVRRMVGETSAKDTIGYDFVSALHSNAGRHVNDEQSYQITILDSVSGCLVYDTVTFTFRGLPNIEPSKVEEYCEAFPTKLPTPTDENYTYKWLRENGTESAETVTLDESEVFSLVEYDKFLCSDTFKVEVNVHKNPKAAPVQDLKLCKDGLELFLSDVVRPDDEHLAANLQVQYFNHVGESMGYDVNTDTIAMAGLKRVLTFTARQTDLIYGCYTDTTFKIELSKGLELQAPDMEAVCEPDTVSLSKHIKNYLNQNLGAVNLPNLSGVVIEYGRLSGPMATRVTEEEANELTYVADHDSVKYMYRVIDAESVCSSTDTLFVVINKQPETPLVEGGADSLFFCADNDPFKIGAENKNSATISSAIFWNGVSELEPTDSITVDKDVNLKSYSAYSKNLKTGCISTSDTVAVVIANAIKVSPIAKNDTLELCANEVMDVAKAAVASFTFDLKYQSDTTILAEVDGLTIPMQTLTAVTSTEQDTTEYIFTAKDELTQCEATNRLVLIFHQKPVVKIDAPTVVCQDTTALLKAVGEKRPVTYAWYMDDANTVASTAGSLTVPSVQVPHSFKLVETLKGTLCADSTTFALDVVTTPNPFADSAFVFCQQNEEELIKFSRPEADDVYNIEWTEDKESVVSSDVKLAVDLSKDTAYVRYARQVNEAKGLACPSEWAKADIKINKHIEVTLPDTFICSPLSFNLAQFANKRKTESAAGYQLAIDRVYLVEGLGSPKSVEDSSKVAKAGKYQINYLDKNGCESQATTNLKFIPKPLTPEVSVDSILLCQGVDTFITVKPVEGEFVYHWLPVGNTTDIQGDTLAIKAALPTTAAMQVWREDADHCMSDTVEFKYSVVDSITTNMIDVQHLCEGETLDLDSLGHLAFNFNDDLTYAYYPLSAAGEKGSQMIQTGAVGDEGAYLVTVDNKASGCKAKTVLNIDVHDNPVLLYKGKTELCENDTFNLVAYTEAGMPKPNFAWTLDEKSTVNDSVLNFISAVETAHVALEQKAELTGTYVITNTKNCVTKQVVTLLTNPAPDALPSDTAELCQNTGNVTLPIENQQGSFNLEITTDGEQVGDITVNTADVANYVFNIRQVDRTTKCKSPSVSVYVNVHSAIKLDLADEVYVCEPETYDLLAVANDSARSNNAGVSEVKTLTISSVVNSGETVENAGQLDKSGTYVVTIADQYNCQAHDQIAVNFVAKPATPFVDAASPVLLCQGADTFLTVKPVVGNYVYHWLPKGTIDTVTADSYAVVAKFASSGDQIINVWRQDADHGCESEKAEVSYRVVDSITTNIIDVQHLCEGETLDLDSLGHLAFNFNDDLTYAYYPLSAAGEKGSQMIQTGAVGDEGAYLVTVDNKASGCKAKTVLNIDVHDNPVLLYKGKTELCENDTFNLVAYTEAGMPKPNFAWTLDEKSTVNDSVLNFISAVETAHVALEQKAELTGTYVITNTKNCVTKQVVTLLTNPAPDALPSDTAELCQNTGNVTLPIEYQQGSFNLEITNEGEQVGDITVNTADVANYVFNIRQVDRTTKCKSPSVPVYVNVHPAIKLDLADEVYVCEPETYDLLAVANDSARSNNAGVSEVKTLTISSVVNSGETVDNAGQLDKSGTYVVTIADQYNCQAHDQIAVNFVAKPATPFVDAASPVLLCQGADTFLTVKPVVGNYVYHWLPKGTIDTITADSYAVVAKFASSGDQIINVWRQDADHGCESEKAEVSYRVVDSITTNIIDVQHLCEGETLDLDSLGHLAFNFNDDLTYAYYPLSAAGEKGSQMIQTGAVGDEGAYLVTVDNKASGCKAKTVLNIDVHDNPVLLYKGKTELCENDTFNLVAFTEAGMPKPNFAWTLDEKSTVNDSVLNFISAVETAHVALEQKAELTGTYVITNTKNCVTKQVVTLLTNPAPDALPSDTAELCQNTGNVTLPIEYQQGSFNLEITNEGEQVGDITINTADVANYVFNIRQVDRTTKCKSPSVPVYVNVHPAISLKLPEISAICQPAVIDFVSVVDKATIESNANISENKQFKTVGYYYNGVELEDASALDKSGSYRAVISDQYGCQASDEVSVSVGLQPEMVKADTGFCQSTGDRLLAGNGSSAAYALQWLNLATAYPDSIFSDSVKVSTLEPGDYAYLMRQVDRKTGCPSEAEQITVTVYPALSVSLRDTMLCYGETFNFVAYAAAQVKGGTNPALDSYARTVSISPLSYEAVAQKGDFYAVYTDEHACSISDTMTIDFAPEIKVVVSSNAPVCEGDTLQIKAEGADFYAWNGGNNDVDNYSVVTTEDGTVQVPLKAGIRVANLSCEIDSVLSFTVKVVPDLLPVADTVIEYCQGTTVDPLILNPSLEGAKVLWYSPADNYTSVAQNGTLVPSSQTAGTSVFRFRQQLDGCSTDQQEITVEIQPAITDLPETFDTAYCLNEATVPLLAKVENPLYDVVWTNAAGDTLPLGYKPSSAEAGLQTYQARLHYRACFGKPVPERVTVALPYGEKPDVDASVLFCQNTGDYTLQANSIPSGARLNWYTTIGGVRYDSIVVPTAEGAVKWTTNNYYVTQSVIDGCESDPLEVTVDIKPSSASKVMAVDTCANLQVKIANVFKRNGVTDVLDTLWRMENGVKERMENTANIGHTATYLAATHNEFGCKALQTVNVRMLQVEDFKYSTIKTMYCFDDTVNLSASSSNATFEWYNPSIDETSFSDSYTFRLQGAQDIRLIATVTSMPACADTVNYEFKTHPYIEPKVDGKMQICVGDQVQLSTSNVFAAEWSVFGDTVLGDNFSFYPEQSCVVNLKGVDKNNCPVSKKLDISTAKVPNPSILVEKNISSPFYHLNRDTFDVKLNAVLDDNYDEGLTYFWNYGDGHEGFGSMTEYYEYDSARVRLTSPITVTVHVAHEYGCSGEATKVLLIDPDFYVPNTMAAGETFMQNYDLQIFDRIGNLIYKGVGWQGQKNNGDDAFADTYFYAINYFVNGDQKVKTGYITLVR